MARRLARSHPADPNSSAGISISTRCPSFRGVDSANAIFTCMTRPSISRPGSSERMLPGTTESGISSTFASQDARLEAFGRDPDLRAEDDPSRVVLVNLGLDPDAVQVGDRDALRHHLAGLAGMRVPGRDGRRHRIAEAHRADDTEASSRGVARRSIRPKQDRAAGRGRRVVQIQSPRLFLEMSPSASTSKGFSGHLTD